MVKINNWKMHIIGWWIAWLSAAVYLIQEGNIDWKNITIYDKAKAFWGCLDWKYSKKWQGYKMRWIRVFENTAYSCTMDLMSRVPSIGKKKKTIGDKFDKFNSTTSVYFKARLIKAWKILNAKKFTLTLKDRIKLSKLLLIPESRIWWVKIEDYFSKEFFKSNFWYEYSTVFAFQPFHSLMEARRYILRSIHRCQYFDTLEPLQVTEYNQYEDMILPIIDWLKSKWVKFMNNTKISNINFKKVWKYKEIENFIIERNWKNSKINLMEWDYAFITLWSMISNSSIWTMTKAPIQKIEKKSVSRTLWEKIAKNNSDFWNPKNYSNKINKTKWVSFTMTIKDPKVLELFKDLITPDMALTWTTIVDSSWFISLWIHQQQYFLNQEDSTSIIWWYWLNPEKKWNYIKKKMIDCNWKELIEEFVCHLWLQDKLDFILKNSVCIPCLTPFVTAHFMPRNKWDRPKVIPDNSKNFAFLWQYTEIPNDIVFTVEYSIRSAQIAVYWLLWLDKKVTPIYKWIYNIKVMLTAIKTIFR